MHERPHTEEDSLQWTLPPASESTGGVEILIDLHCKFPRECHGEGILKIGSYLPKLFSFINCNTATVHCGWHQTGWRFESSTFTSM